ncbi:hypothetical protein [Streptomyces pseudovenezuelae]|uniref:Uncharacterized protein n=1 Tax=Streptomyces pseudovenezuelae TaxID=67350 RepID=A0ABZ1WMD1_9ACTN|nr:hypothetical protein [Streptomyces pseudovenezuelae]
MTVVGPSWSRFWSGPAADLSGTRGAGQAGAVPDGKRAVMIGVDTGGGDRLALAVLLQYRMATTE